MDRREKKLFEKRKKREARLKRARVRATTSGADPLAADAYEPEPAVSLRQPYVPPVGTAFLSERALRVMYRAMQGKEFDSPEEFQAFAESALGTRIDALDATDESLDPKERAQELAFRAMECDTRENARDWAHLALALDADCTDALTVLALVDSRRAATRIALLAASLEAGARALGGEPFFAENRGRFWGLAITRPYMRTRQVLADTLLADHRTDEAVLHYEALLDLNPDDNQGVRFALLGPYLELERLEPLRALLESPSLRRLAAASWARALERWIARDRVGAARAVREGERRNAFVRDALSSSDTFLDSNEAWSIGSEEEAESVAFLLGRAWRRHADALRWLKEGAHASTKRERLLALRSYSDPVTALLALGEVQFGSRWIDYPEHFKLTQDHIAELTRMALDAALLEIDGDNAQWACIHAWRALGQLQATGALDALAQIVREHFEDDNVLEDLPRVLAKIGLPAAGVVRELFSDQTIDIFMRSSLASVLTKFAQMDEQLHRDWAQHLREILSSFARNDPDLNSCAIQELIETARDPADLELVQRAFEADAVDMDSCESLDVLMQRVQAK